MTKLFPTTPLARSKALATGFFVVALLLFIVGHALNSGATFWGYLIAFSEAAMVGALADWFAVTALFRHPLGLALPHTAIIPKNKARIASNLGQFICEHFLATEQVMRSLKQWQLPRKSMRWLAQKQNAQQVSAYAGLVAQHSIKALRDVRAQQFMQQTAVANLKNVNFALLAAQVLELLTADQRHQALLNKMLKELSALLQKESVQQFVATRIAAEVKRTVHLKRISDYVGEWGTERIVKLVAQEIQAIAEDPHHELRYRFNAHVYTFIARLKTDPAFAAQIVSLQEQWLNEPIVMRYLSELWTSVLDWIEADLDQNSSELQQRFSTALRQVAHHILQDAAMEQLLEEKLQQLAPPLIEKYRGRIALYIETQVNAWEDDDLVYQLEHAIGKDLQYIRINGTLVGGLVGLMIHFCSRFF